jgi:FAD:protein FMN transferase
MPLRIQKQCSTGSPNTPSNFSRLESQRFKLNRMAERMFLLVGLILVIGMTPREMTRFYLAGKAQGTTYQVTYYAERDIVIQQEIDSIFEEIDSSLSVYKPYSLISKFNASSGGVSMDDHFAAVVRRSLEINQEFPEYFDITIYPITVAWKVISPGGMQISSGSPDSSRIHALIDCVGSSNLQIKNGVLQKTKPCVQLDVNGIAQGYTVDVIADFMESRKIFDYLIEVGGEIRVKGLKYPGQSRMTIGIERPSHSPIAGAVLDKIIVLDEGAVTTSGNYRKYRQAGGKRVSHLMNPLTGYPIKNEMISVTIVADDAMTADGFDNVLMGAGWKTGLTLLKNYPGIEAYFIYQKEDGTSADTATTGFYKLFKPL